MAHRGYNQENHILHQHLARPHDDFGGWVRPARAFNAVSSLVLNPELPVMKGYPVRRKNSPLSVPVFVIAKRNSEDSIPGKDISKSQDQVV